MIPTILLGSVAQGQEAVVKESPFYEGWAEKAKPDYMVGRSYGYMGAMAVGAGYRLWDMMDADLSFGYTPRSLGGVVIRQFNTMADFDVLDIEYEDKPWGTIKAGFGVIYGFDRDLFGQLPKKYPKGYYAPTAIRYVFGVGVEAPISEVMGISLDYHFLDSELNGYKKSFQGIDDGFGTTGISLYHLLH